MPFQCNITFKYHDLLCPTEYDLNPEETILATSYIETRAVNHGRAITEEDTKSISCESLCRFNNISWLACSNSDLTRHNPFISLQNRHFSDPARVSHSSRPSFTSRARTGSNRRPLRTRASSRRRPSEDRRRETRPSTLCSRDSHRGPSWWSTDWTAISPTRKSSST